MDQPRGPADRLAKRLAEAGHVDAVRIEIDGADDRPLADVGTLEIRRDHEHGRLEPSQQAARDLAEPNQAGVTVGR
ncbi:MAG TPA: hypothetical protein VM869_01845, partial [Enhygromyxa sp.]|nr:hypothetical protein [Enhygromyxa sp.]